MLVRPLSLLVLVASCQGGSAPKKQEPAATPASGASSAGAKAIEVRDAKGTITASISVDRPCRANVDGIELIVGTQPLVATIGAVQWTGDDDNGGTLLKRDGEPVARVSGTPDALGLFDTNGVAIVRATMADSAARVVSGKGVVLRTATRTSSGIAVGDRTVTGTDDLLLAAVLAAPEARPEVRALAACQRSNQGDRAL